MHFFERFWFFSFILFPNFSFLTLSRLPLYVYGCTAAPYHEITNRSIRPLQQILCDAMDRIRRGVVPAVERTTMVVSVTHVVV
jgi:hypothetical protein